MAGNCFIKFSKTGAAADVPGESQQDGHAGKDGWVEIGDWSWDIEAESSVNKGTGAAVGKPTAGAFSFSHFYDKSSPVLMSYIVRGAHFDQFTMDILKQTGGVKPELYFQFTAKNVFITKVGSKGGEDGAVSQDIEMVFKECAVGYKQQDNNGQLKKAPKEFKWNIATMDDKTTVKLGI